jgi:5-phospho-D-xylono-1,4-lactonase
MAVDTVLGPRALDSLRVIDAHAHLWISGSPPGSPRLADEQLALGELRSLRAAGGDALIDCQPPGCGRDARVLRRLMSGSGVTVVAVTGFHLRRHYREPGGVWADPDGAHELFRHELGVGLEEAPQARAGAVKCAWTGEPGVERELLGAAVEAARSEGAPLIVHTERGHAAEELAELVTAAGLPPGRVQLSHMDKRRDLGLHLELARAGFVLGYDTFLRSRHDPERGVWPLLHGVLDAGLWGQVTLGTDLVEVADWCTGGGPGLRALPFEVAGRLRREGVDGRALAALAGGNAARLLGTATRVPT